MSYEAQKKLVIGFLVVYFVGGMYAVDQYPFFNWSLFSKIPNVERDFTIVINSFDGVTYDPPLPFSESRFIIDAIGRSPTDFTPRFLELGTALEQGNTAGADALLAFITQMFDGKPYSFSLVEIIYDPVEVWKDGTYRERKDIATYDSEHVP